MAKIKGRAAPRRERTYPQSARIYSKMFPQNIENTKFQCFVAYDDYRKLEEKYLKLFKRYKRKTLK